MTHYTLELKDGMRISFFADCFYKKRMGFWPFRHTYMCFMRLTLSKEINCVVKIRKERITYIGVNK